MNVKPSNFRCLYCDKEKPICESTLEHGIPQFLGGKYAPKIFEFKNVCGWCNSTLGRHVDASFARSWFVSAAIQNNAMTCYDAKTRQFPIPLMCMGITSHKPPNILDEVCESWVGPLGEQIFLIRKHDEKIYWYVGGDPIKPKQTQSSRAYFFFSERSHLAPQITWDSFKEAYSNEKTKKIMCTEVRGADPSLIGFSSPDDLDSKRIGYFKQATSIKRGYQKNSLPINVDFDHRFLCKLALAVAYGLFGEDFLASKYAEELRKGIWHRPDANVDFDEIECNTPLINGLSSLEFGDEKLNKILFTKGSVVILIMQVAQGFAMQLMIGERSFGCIKIADSQLVTPEIMQNFGNGVVFIFYKFLKRSLSMPLPSYLAHKLGNVANQELHELENNISNNDGYFRNLKLSNSI